MRPPRMVPSMQKNMKSSTSVSFHVEPGFCARTRARNQPTANATRYMIPYQWTLKCSVNKCRSKGPISNAMLLNLGYGIMSGAILLSFASHATEKGLEVTRFGDCRVHRMIRRLAAEFQ